MFVCRICNNANNNKVHITREMMFGYKDIFEYIECANCGCLQIKEFPVDTSKYYPDNYYSFQNVNVPKDSWIASLARKHRAEYCLYGKNILGWLIAKLLCVPDYYAWFKKVGLDFDSHILEVGSGTGQRLQAISREGFTNLVGVDPYIESDIIYDSGVKILKNQLSEIDGQFDFIMLHHTFEHVPNPFEILQDLYQLVKPDHFVLIRIPLTQSFAWRKYGVNWLQLDPPRHFYLHTIKSMQILVEKTGFVIRDIVYDSSDCQFWGSEQYLKNMPLTDTKSYFVNPKNSMFSEREIQSFKNMAEKLNQEKDGDQACFYLFKPSN